MGPVTFPLAQQWQGWALCFLLSCTYVGSLYMVPARIRALRRDNPTQILARFGSVSAAAAVCVMVLKLLAKPSQSPDAADFHVWIGLPGGEGLVCAVACSLTLICCLFLGPLMCMALMSFKRRTQDVDVFGNARPAERRRSLLRAAAADLLTRSGATVQPYATLRNLLVGPVTEEVVFRGCFLPILLSAGASRGAITCASPLLFGLAHAHHIREGLRNGRGFLAAAVPVLVQLSYTSVFGALVALIHLRTGHLCATAACHILCNFMGLPDLSFNVPPGDYARPTYHLLLAINDSDGRCNGRRSNAQVIWASYGVGVILFFRLFYPLTETSAAASHLWQYQHPT
ncbi:hypothetical protein JKP88DRAFT_313425 [Tribonema minus]|uniref:intramembrane prenyl-peptidase Rce1 n=1 Tax=Tribonema minus TaxID=303371 RepID=A0A835Z1X7_9STRA|nr:hypothetical protein JKP88DRAFT_313425 [Tribonema minus]